MANNVSTLKFLRCSIVGIDGIGEGPSHQVGDLDLDVEGLVGSNIFVRSREDDNRRDHVVVGWNITHNNTVARTLGDLLAVRNGFAGTEIDEVEWISLGVRLASSNIRRAYRVGCCLDIGLEQRQTIGTISPIVPIIAIIAVVVVIVVVSTLSVGIVVIVVVIVVISAVVVVLCKALRNQAQSSHCGGEILSRLHLVLGYLEMLLSQKSLDWIWECGIKNRTESNERLRGQRGRELNKECEKKTVRNTHNGKEC